MPCKWYNYVRFGEVPERTNGTVLKTVEGQPSVGSNPTLPATVFEVNQVHSAGPARLAMTTQVESFRTETSFAVNPPQDHASNHNGFCP